MVILLRISKALIIFSTVRPWWCIDDHGTWGWYFIVQRGDLARVLPGHLQAGLPDVEGSVALVRVGGHLVVKVWWVKLNEREVREIGKSHLSWIALTPSPEGERGGSTGRWVQSWSWDTTWELSRPSPQGWGCRDSPAPHGPGSRSEWSPALPGSPVWLGRLILLPRATDLILKIFSIRLLFQISFCYIKVQYSTFRSSLAHRILWFSWGSLNFSMHLFSIRLIDIL